MSTIPRIISVDDHVVEPPHLWQTWLPKAHREHGPRVERANWAPFVHEPGARYRNTMDPDGEAGDYWVFEDEIIYVHKKFVAIPLEATPDGDVGSFDRSVMTMTPVTYDAMRPGCYDRDARIADFELNWVDGSLPFPTFPRFCGQTFTEATDKDLGLACVRAYNDWMVDEWCEPSGGVNIPLAIIPLWDARLAAAEVERNAARGVHAVCFSEIPPRLGLPSIHSGDWDPLFAACNANGVVLCMHIGSSSTTPAASPDSPEAVGGTLAFNNAFASLADWLFSGKLIEFPDLQLAYSEGQIGWIPYILERTDHVWEANRAWGDVGDSVPEPPSTYFHRQIYACFFEDEFGLTSEALNKITPQRILFETDYPHSDSVWPETEATAQRLMGHLDQETVNLLCRGNAIKLLDLDLPVNP